MPNWSVRDTRITSHQSCSIYCRDVVDIWFQLTWYSHIATGYFTVITALEPECHDVWLPSNYTVCNKNTNQITDISILQFICKLQNFMHTISISIQSIGEPTHSLLLVLAGYAGRYPPTSGCSLISNIWIWYVPNLLWNQLWYVLLYRSAQLPILHGMVEWISAYRLSNSDGGCMW